jgi:hypothetical protein
MFDVIRRFRPTPGSFEARVATDLDADPGVARVEPAGPFALSVRQGDAAEPATVFLDNA